MDEDQTPGTVREAGNAHTPRHALAQLTRGAWPAPEVSRVPGSLRSFGSFMPHTSTRLARGRMEPFAEYDVPDQGNTPAPSLALAGGHLAGDAQSAGRMGGEPASARGADARRGSGSASQDRLDTETA